MGNTLNVEVEIRRTKMSKELEALGRLRNTFALLTEVYGQNVLQDAAIIESALKDYEKLKDEYDKLGSIYTHFIKQYNQLLKDHTKMLMALEVIKKLMHKSGTEYWLYETENDYVFADFRISKEEFDLLKEVLL